MGGILPILNYGFAALYTFIEVIRSPSFLSVVTSSRLVDTGGNWQIALWPMLRPS
jgi:hypothetical protein